MTLWDSHGRLHGVAAAAALLLSLVVGGLAGCAAGGPRGGSGPRNRETIDRPGRVLPPPPAREVEVRLAARPGPGNSAQGFGPEVLDPPTPAVDGVVARVGDVEIRKSQVFDRILLDARQQARTWVDVAVGDVVVAEMARRYEIRLDVQRVEELAEEQEELLRTEVELTGRYSLEEYVQRLFDLELDEYREAVRRNVAMVRYRGLVIRYLGLLEDRVEARYMVHGDTEVLCEVRDKVRQGADFAALAKQLSEDGSQRDGGYLAPFGRAFRHPVATTAFGLEVGAVSDPIPMPGSERHAIVYCLRKLPRRDVPFAEVQREIEAGLDQRPITPFEQNAFVMQYCRSTGDLSADDGGR